MTLPLPRLISIWSPRPAGSALISIMPCWRTRAATSDSAETFILDSTSLPSLLRALTLYSVAGIGGAPSQELVQLGKIGGFLACHLVADGPVLHQSGEALVEGVHSVLGAGL